MIANGHHYLNYLHFFCQIFLGCFPFLIPMSMELKRRNQGLRSFLRKVARAKCQNDMLEVVISGVGVRPPRPDNGHNGCLESPGWPHQAASPHTPGRLRGDIPRVHRCGQETLWGSSLTITTRTLQHDTLWDGDPETDTSGEGQRV